MRSPWLNLSLYPDEVDYPRSLPLDPTWHALQSCVRDSDAPWTPPDGDGPLVYLSLGSLGSADLPLMQHLVASLAGTPYRVVVSKGPLHDQLDLPDGMTGAEFLPQASLLPQVDLVITHGGNNTVTECLHHGKPMVVLPLFWDQFDNAQRIARDRVRSSGCPPTSAGRAELSRLDRGPAGRPGVGRPAGGGVPPAQAGAGHGQGGRPDRASRDDEGAGADPMTPPMFGPDVTFLGVERCDLADPSSYAGADVVIIGAPFDSGTSYRSGARFGPMAIRSTDYLPHDGSRPHLALGVDPLRGHAGARRRRHRVMPPTETKLSLEPARGRRRTRSARRARSR